LTEAASPLASGDRAGGDHHLAQHPALDRLRHVRRSSEKGHQRDLGPDADQEQQERVDNEGGVQRFQITHHGSISEATRRADVAVIPEHP
jgi:hypothetical protein